MPNSITMQFRICVVIVTHARTQYLKRCINSLYEAIHHCPIAAISTRVLVNGIDPSSYQLLLDYLDVFPLNSLRVCKVETSLTPAVARNRLLQIEGVSGAFDWVYFLDDDAYVPKDHFSKFIQSTQRFPWVAAIGGPNLTPPDSNFFQHATGSTLASRWGTLISFCRYRAYGKMRICDDSSLILCNLFVHSRCFKNEGFQEDLLCSEENWLLQTLASQGEKALYHPDLTVWHERRPCLSQFAAQVFKYGYGRGQTIRRRPKSARIFHLLPSLTIICLLLPTLHSFVFKFGCLYFFSSTICTLILSTAYKKTQEFIKFLFIAPFLFPVIHVSYGLGVLSGLLGAAEQTLALRSTSPRNGDEPTF